MNKPTRLCRFATSIPFRLLFGSNQLPYPELNQNPVDAPGSGGDFSGPQRVDTVAPTGWLPGHPRFARASDPRLQSPQTRLKQTLCEVPDIFGLAGAVIGD
jgi:hypothetical protein